MKRALIIKTGWSETLDPDEGGSVSLGDILRTTVILHLLGDYEVTWLVDKKGYPLLKGNPLIHRILSVNEFTPSLLLSEQFEIIINLEKDLGICYVSDRIPALRRYGFRLDHWTHEAVAYDWSETAISLSRDHEAKRNNKRSWSKLLYEMLGSDYEDQPYVLGYKPESEVIHKVGFNYLIGGKFPTKAWPTYHWHALGAKLGLFGYSVSWQEGTDDIFSYIEWISSCETLVTNDSLGMHIAMALGKRVIAMFGPTSASEVDGAGLTKIVAKDGFMDSIGPERVFKEVRNA